MEASVATLSASNALSDIIDVDALDDSIFTITGFRSRHPRGLSDSLATDGLAYLGFRRAPNPRRSQTTSGARAGPSTRLRDEDVIVLNSDDDDAAPSTSRAGRGHTGSHARLRSPPPPRPVRGYTPDVPTIPSDRELSRRRRRHLHSPIAVPPSIRPSEQPMPFENRIGSLPRLPPRGAAPAFAPAARSHHQPAMGFGGAMIALNRQHAAEEAQRREHEETQGFFTSFSDIFRRLQNYRSRLATPDGPQGWGRYMPWAYDTAEPTLDPEFDMNDDWLRGFPAPPSLGNHHQQEKAHYRPEYTHPMKAAPGFTHDFAPVDDSPAAASPGTIVIDDNEAGPSNAGSSSSSVTAVETTLVCARCLDPLVLAPPTSASEDVRKRTRVWALRCGHMFDGKCMEAIMAPPQAPEDDALLSSASASASGSAKGKGKAQDDWSSSDETGSTSDAKGKRKAAGPPAGDAPPRKRHEASYVPEDSSLVPSVPEEGGMRSRLRSHRRPGVGDAATSASRSGPAPVAESAATPTQTARGPRKARGSRGKGKGRAKAPAGPVYEAEHEWRCPVAGCNHAHISVLMEGEWLNDATRGGIALFV
ncbi:uncharacterized protein BXZ73DRAFT_38458 [Epithele typhae]|uniref:uncharacterized protein n=1 Tax=Epithele typhae TaxID=378194 RepID=UPI002008BC13|nr:uncharacterized protein BXZ73DRAFT_38458 [Epithele typhae]KAH9945426.1 hypothetical protein BXZ73DRAFT_38458 [Epithele typhae]